MSIERFVSHIADASPAFRCYSCGDDSESLDLLAIVSNQLGSPASVKDIAKLEKLLGAAAAPFEELYRHCNGCTLYRDSQSDAAGLEFYSIAMWSSRSNEMRADFNDMGREEDELPQWITRGIAFGCIPHSGNYFVIDPSGDESQAIYYADHDGLEYEPVAATLTEFLDALRNDPAEFMLDYGCYTRYSDGKSSKQWIPKQYVADTGR